jgi:oxygen-independent coproporphyrinogen-3 oxidase
MGKTKIEARMSETNTTVVTDPATSKKPKRKTETGSVFVSNYPPFSHWNKDSVSEALKSLQRPPKSDTRLGLYVHIPFCRKRCKFCYFKVYTGKNNQDITNYLNALYKEVEIQHRMPAFTNQELEFVYFGGGTPSFISVDHLNELVNKLKSSFSWKNVKEFAFECEPGTLTRSKLVAIKDIGVTRLSLGIEHFSDSILELNGRAHRSPEIYKIRPWIEELNFDQLNIDLIAGMIGDSWESWKETVQKAIEYKPDSITVYQLELPYNTLFSKDIGKGDTHLSIPDWDLKRAYHAYAIDQFSAAGFDISSAYTMATKNTNFVYRDSLWKGCNMLSFGVSSFSHVNGVHFQNVGNWDEYINSLDKGELPIDRAYRLSEKEQLTRELILQLKLGHISKEYFKKKFVVDIVSEFYAAFEELQLKNMLEINNEKIQLTRGGLLRVDELLPTFYNKKYRESRYT